MTAIGRPCRLTDETQATIVEALGHVGTWQGAADAAGISYETLRGWLRQGEADGEAGLGTPFSALVAACKRARYAFRRERMARIKAAGQADPRNWPADMTAIARVFPEEYGERQKVEHSGSIGGGVTVNLVSLAGAPRPVLRSGQVSYTPLPEQATPAQEAPAPRRLHPGEDGAATD